MIKLQERINRPEYDFLRTNPNLGRRILFLTLGGSHAYGTAVEGSDVDIRGCTAEGRREIMGFSEFEQVTERETDTVIYGFRKLIRLLLQCNPNTIELLGCKEEHYFLLTPIGKQILENRKLFLSRRAAYSFGGYASQQLRRLENAMARDSYPQTEKEKHILASCLSAMMSFGERYSRMPEGAIRLSIGASEREELETEIFVDAALKHYPLRDFNGIWADLNNILKDYSKLNKRERKKDDAHLNKHAMHLIRLYFMCIDIFENGEIVTYREKERELLLAIRNGAFQNSDHTFRPAFFELLSDLEKRLCMAQKESSLPEQPDMKKIEEFVISVNERTALW